MSGTNVWDHHPEPMPKLFKGATSTIWERRLVEHGWPQPMAGLIAAFMVGSGPMPYWLATHRSLSPGEELTDRFGDHVTGGGEDEIKPCTTRE
jgi:hypothetical protein